MKEEPKQKQVLRLVFQLAEHPTQLGDYATRDEDCREIQHLMPGGWHFSFWAVRHGQWWRTLRPDTGAADLSQK